MSDRKTWTADLSHTSLHSLQEESGYIHDGAVPARHVLKVCRAEFCHLKGAESLSEHIQNRLGIPLGGTTKDGRITLEQIYCLGMCGSSPALMLDDTLYARVSRQVADSLIDNALRAI